MKSKKIDLTCDVNTCAKVTDLVAFLEIVGIKSANDQHEYLNSTMDNDFCDHCDAHVNDCDCDKNNSYHHGGRYMREYDDGASLED